MTGYDFYVVAFSGGKDSIACFLHLLDLDVPKEKIELWHHCIDGEDSSFMDWPVTKDYCRKFADAFNVPIYFSWKIGGFKREMLRNNQPTAPTVFEYPTPHGKQEYQVGGKGPKGTREKFPQVSANLSVRWCSAYCKIDVCRTAINNQDRFKGKRTLIITGERSEESAARSKYAEFEPHHSDLRDGKKFKRLVDHWRPVKNWSEKRVWDILRNWGVNPHPAYKMGWGRLSCAGCIFGNSNQFASLREVNPNQFKALCRYEAQFGITIKRNISLPELAEKGTPYPSISTQLAQEATSPNFKGYVIIYPDGWEYPAGAFGDTCGPT